MLCVVCLIFSAASFAGTTTYVYDELDRLHEVQFGNGNGIRYEYDKIGNLLSKTPFGNVFTLIASASEGGSISPMGTLTITAGSNKSYSIVPLTGFKIADVAVDGVSKGAVPSYSFNNITGDHTISASFATFVNKDFNQDGSVDILWQNDDGSCMLWNMNGPSYVSTTSMPPEPDTNWKMVATGDFNNDGKPDIVWRNRSTGDNRIWLMNGTTLITSVTLPTDANLNAKIGGTGDFNNDGNIDIVWRDATVGTTYVWFMNGISMSGNAVITPANTDAAVKIVGTGDFNGDSKIDILTRSTLTGATTIWLMDGITKSVELTIYPQNTNLVAEIVGTGDFNKDGKIDVLWRNPSNGNNFFWLMDGVIRASNSIIQSQPLPLNAGWHIVGR